MAEILYTTDIIPIEQREALTEMASDDNFVVHDTSKSKIKKITKANLKEDLGINDNTDNIATNADNITTNTANIATNTTNIDLKADLTDVADNTDDIATNASNIATNTTAIALNTTHRSSDGKNHSDVVLNNAHRVNVSNPHSVTKTQIGLGNVPNLTFSGSNTGDQTTITGNAGTATALETARNIAGNSFDGTADIDIASTDLSDTANLARTTTANTFSQDQTYSAFLKVLGTAADRHLITRGIGGSSTDGSTVDDLYINYGQSKGAKWGTSGQSSLLANGGASISGDLSVSGTITGTVSGNSETATKLATPVNIAGNSFDGSEDIDIVNDDLTRISKQGYISSGYEYYELATLPIDNAGNYASIIFNGRIGGWVGTQNVAYFTALLSNRSNYTGDNLSASVQLMGMGSAGLAISTIVAYKQTDLSTKLYIKVNGYYTFDFSYQKYQSSTLYNYTGTSVTPTGTEIWDLKDADCISVDLAGNLSVSGTVDGVDVGTTVPSNTAAIALKADKATSVVSYTASHTLALTDAYKMLKITSTSDLTITIPTNSSVAFDTNTEIVVVRYGTGSVTFASSATINSLDGNLSISGQYGSVTLKKIATDEWLLIGALS